MDYLWLVITVLSLIAGVGLLIALTILRRLSGHSHPPVELVVAGLVAIGVAAFFGVYLRVLEIPRSVIPYRVINSAAWSFVVYGCLAFLLHRAAGAGIHRIAPAAAGMLMWGAAYLVVHAPIADQVFQAVAILVLELLVGGLAIITAVAALRRAGAVKSVPWRIVQRGTGIALLILVSANLVEFLVAMVLRLRGHAAPDGFLFSLGYGIACAVLAFALIRALRIRGLAESRKEGDVAGRAPGSAPGGTAGHGTPIVGRVISGRKGKTSLPQGNSPESPQQSRFAAGWRRTCRLLDYVHAGIG